MGAVGRLRGPRDVSDDAHPGDVDVLKVGDVNDAVTARGGRGEHGGEGRASSQVDLAGESPGLRAARYQAVRRLLVLPGLHGVDGEGAGEGGGVERGAPVGADHRGPKLRGQPIEKELVANDCLGRGPLGQQPPRCPLLR
jgi:hypothetical protein